MKRRNVGAEKDCDHMHRYYFSGIGGSGMSALAHVLKARGHWVGGSGGG